LKFETKNQIYHLSATADLKRAKEILELLDVLNLLEGEAGYILDQLSMVAPFLNNPRKPPMVAKYVLHYFWHLPGPEHVQIKKTDIVNLGKAIDLLVWMATLESAVSGNLKTLKSFINSLYELFEIAENYRLTKVKRKIIREVRSVKKDTSGLPSKALPMLEKAERDFQNRL